MVSGYGFSNIGYLMLEVQCNKLNECESFNNQWILDSKEYQSIESEATKIGIITQAVRGL